jgi:hypothetical protein
MGVGSQRRAPFALPRQKPGTHCTGVRVGSRVGWEGGKAENLVLTGNRPPNRSTRPVIPTNI